MTNHNSKSKEKPKIQTQILLDFVFGVFLGELEFQIEFYIKKEF
jgi:hypothetical protein